MSTPTLRYSPEEHARRGNELYETQIRPIVETGNHGKIVAIDIETGAFELADSTMAATARLLDRYPNAQIWRIRIGHEGFHRIGYRALSPISPSHFNRGCKRSSIAKIQVRL
jgi:hypothetical protein